MAAGTSDGVSRIGEAMNKGVAPEHWETKWVELLREYEKISMVSLIPEITLKNGIGCERTKSRRTRERTATGCVRQGTACGSNGERLRSYLDEAGLMIVRTDGHR